MKSFLTSYSGLFGRDTPGAPHIDHVEIPLIQRDYAQGRRNPRVDRIRERFLGALHKAIVRGPAIDLDFVYGDVQEGTLRPLDGQQRLTTLFLLHWYLAARTGRLGEAGGWQRLTYATRPGARTFCEKLVESTPPADAGILSDWIRDQAWFRFTWRHDPTVQAMLVMIDAIDARFNEVDFEDSWGRLTHPADPAIRFHLLPINEFGLDNDLYIKMNSRGKPLTHFENFKARFEEMLEKSVPDRLEEFARKVDTDWSDLLWPYHGGDHIIDQEFMHLFHFIAEVSGWRRGLVLEGDAEALAERLYGPGADAPAEDIDFLIRALDTWNGLPIKDKFEHWFGTTPDPDGTDRVLLYAPEVDLFGLACAGYGEARGKGRGRQFTYPQTLLLYAVLLHRLLDTPDFPRRLRVVRNLVEASAAEIRVSKMPEFVRDVENIIVDGDLSEVSAFNTAQVEDERLKASFLKVNLDLETRLLRLEDHHLLRGCLGAFDLDATTFEARAAAFHEVFAPKRELSAVTGALLAVGDYSRRLRNQRFFQFGSSTEPGPWRLLLTGTGRAKLAETRAVLGRLLDAVAASAAPVEQALDELQTRFLTECAAAERYGWRYHLVRRRSMRSGTTGLYVGMGGRLAYEQCMLRATVVRSWYRDPFLYAMYVESEVGAAVEDPWFWGYESHERWMQLQASGVSIRNTDAGLLVRADDEVDVDVLEPIVRAYGAVWEDDLGRWVIAMPQTGTVDTAIDTVDRVDIGSKLLRDLVAAGF